jgi:hypothetical protein
MVRKHRDLLNKNKVRKRTFAREQERKALFLSASCASLAERFYVIGYKKISYDIKQLNRSGHEQLSRFDKSF